MSARSRTPRKSTAGRGRSVTPQAIPEGEEGGAGEVASSSGVTGSGRSQSPMSPGQQVRIEEKEELQNLNSRLAAYIDRVRSLQDENQRLSVQMRSKEEVVTREVNAVKSTYEAELNQAKTELEQAVRDRTNLQLEKRNLKAANQELTEQNNRLQRDLKQRDADIAANQQRMAEMNNKMTALQVEADRANTERRKAVDKLNDAMKDLDGAKKEVVGLRQAVDDADRARVDAESQLQGALDKLELSKNVHEQQLREVRATKQMEISEVDTRLKEEYETRLQDSLDELREHYENMMARGREEADRVYEDKMNNMKTDFERKLRDAATRQNESRNLKSELDVVKRRLTEAETRSKEFEDHAKRFEVELENEKNRYTSMLQEKTDTIDSLQQRIEDLTRQIQDILAENVRLDLEIATYRSLLEGEESRLNLSTADSAQRAKRARLVRGPRGAAAAAPSSSQSPLQRLFTVSRGVPALGSGTPSGEAVMSRGRKRAFAHVSSEESEESVTRSLGADGDLEIMEVNATGEYVKVRNKGTTDVTMTGYMLKHIPTGSGSGDNEVTFKFPRINLKAGSNTTVWSSDTKTVHQAPDNLVMKNQKWTMGARTRTRLLDPSEAEIAWFQLDREISSRATASSSVRGGEEDLHHQRDDPSNCCLM